MVVLLKIALVRVCFTQIMKIRVQNKRKSVRKSRYVGDILDAGAGGHVPRALEAAHADGGACRRRAAQAKGAQGGGGGGAHLPRRNVTPQQTPEEAALVAYQAAYNWTGPPPIFIDLTGGNDDNKGKADD